jgi:hypothetical protein
MVPSKVVISYPPLDGFLCQRDVFVSCDCTPLSSITWRGASRVARDETGDVFEIHLGQLRRIRLAGGGGKSGKPSIKPWVADGVPWPHLSLLLPVKRSTAAVALPPGVRLPG